MCFMCLLQDAHSCLIDFDADTKTSLFAVYDGHGGIWIGHCVICVFCYLGKEVADVGRKLA